MSVESVVLSEVEKAALTVIESGPQVPVHIHIAVKFRVGGTTLGSVVVVDHTFELPIPTVFAKANPELVHFNTRGIDVTVSLAAPVAAEEKVAAVPAVPAVPAASAPVAVSK